MPYASITLSSVGTSTPANLNWRGGKPTTIVVVSSAAGSSATFTVQYTLDDLQVTPSGAQQTTAGVSWFGVSSNTYAVDIGGATFFNASAAFPDGVYIPFPGPIAAVRINSSSMASGSGLTMKVMQGEGWALLIAALGGSLLLDIINGAMHWTNLVA